MNDKSAMFEVGDTVSVEGTISKIHQHYFSEAGRVYNIQLNGMYKNIQLLDRDLSFVKLVKKGERKFKVGDKVWTQDKPRFVTLFEVGKSWQS